MIGWVFLVAAILTEVGATLSLRMTIRGLWLWYVPVVAGYVFAFANLSLALSAGVPLGVAYGIWVAIGVALTALLSRIMFKEPLTLGMIAGIALVGAGVLCIELGRLH